MEITKYEHACLLINKNGARLLIDPGNYTNLPAKLEAHYNQYFKNRLDIIEAVGV